MSRFDGKVAFVTGAGGGIGAATAARLSSDGAKVAVVDLSVEAAQATVDRLGGGDRLLAVQADVSRQESVEAAFHAVEMRLGPVDYLVNAAGVRGVGSVLDTTPEVWKLNLEVNLQGSFLTCQRFSTAAVNAGRGGAIVNIASQAGLEGLPNRLAYVTTKHAIPGLTRAVAMDLARKGVRVNCIAPGFVETPMTRVQLADEKLRQTISNAHPIGRWAQPEEMANVISFLLSEEASFITGAILPVDGGVTAGAASFN